MAGTVEESKGRDARPIALSIGGLWRSLRAARPHLSRGAARQYPGKDE